MLTDVIHNISESITFTIMDLGSRPVGAPKEHFYALADLFPGSRIIAIDVDQESGEQSDKQSVVTYYPAFLGRAEEERPFYETMHPMCNSLYKPNAQLLERYQNLEVMRLKSVSNIKTISLDQFVRENDIGTIDFIKIDIQGAELDVFQGGISTLKNVLSIISEVEFVPMYENQPLFGDVCAFLAKEGIHFHRFFVLRGRALKPTVIQNNPEFATHHLWSDALFFKEITQQTNLTDEQLVKMGIIADMYGSPDLAVVCFMEYDRRRQTQITQAYLGGISGNSGG